MDCSIIAIDRKIKGHAVWPVRAYPLDVNAADDGGAGGNLRLRLPRDAGRDGREEESLRAQERTQRRAAAALRVGQEGPLRTATSAQWRGEVAEAAPARTWVAPWVPWASPRGCRRTFCWDNMAMMRTGLVHVSRPWLLSSWVFYSTLSPARSEIQVRLCVPPDNTAEIHNKHRKRLGPRRTSAEAECRRCRTHMVAPCSGGRALVGGGPPRCQRISCA